MPVSLATIASPPVLCRFLDFGTRGDGFWPYKALFTHGHMPCSNPANFNDPHDGVPCFDDFYQERLGEDAETVIQRKEEQLGGRLPPEIRVTELWKARRSLISNYREHIPEYLETVRQGLGKEGRIVCLSEEGNLQSNLMWAHYGEKHKGFAVVFDFSAFPLNKAVQTTYKVDYGNRRPRIVSPDPMGPEHYTHKGLDWGYEREWRICLKSEDLHLDKEGRCFLPLWETCISAIYLGCRFRPLSVEKGFDFLRHFKGAKLFQMRSDTSDYSLTWTRIQ